MNKKLLYYTQKTKRKKEPHCMGKVRMVRIFLFFYLLIFFYVFYIFVSQKRNCELFTHVTIPSEGKKKTEDAFSW